MKRTIAWVLILMSWCAIARAEGTYPGCSEGVKLPIDQLVLRGLATPDELIVRVPDFLAGFGVPFLNLFKRSPVFREGTPEPISDELFVMRLKPDRSMTLAEKAQRLQQLDFLVSQVAEIRITPAEIVIPETLDEIIRPVDIRDIFNLLNPAVVNSADTTAAAVPFDWSTTRTEPSPYVYALRTPTDIYFPMQCGMNAVNAEMAWDTTYRAPSVYVAIVDSGLADMHDDLDPYAKPNDATVDLDKNGHGTHVAGIVGALGDGAIGVVGVTWRTNITAYRFLDASGRGTLAGAVKQIDLALKAAPKPHIIVLAWGSGVHSTDLLDLLEKDPDVLFVAAAGNLTQNTCDHPVFPAAYDLPNLISVMATTCHDLRAPFSNYGQRTVDLAAPGEGRSKNMRIYSTVLNDLWGNLAGTSMSAAFVAGAAALVLEPSVQAGTPYKPYQVKCWLNGTATPLLDLKGRSKSEGRLDLAEAVKPLNETSCPP